MTDSVERILTFAKSGKFTRSELYAKMCGLAEAQREPGKSEAQAFAKFVSTPEGRELFQIQQSLPGRDIEIGWQAPIAKSSPSDWDGLVAGLMRVSNCSYSKAVDAALATEEGRFAFSKVRRIEKIKSGFSVADMECDDAIAAQQNGYRDMHKRGYRSDFEALVDGVIQARPHLTRSQAMDHVRSIKPHGEAAWAKFKTQRGATLP